MYIYIYIDVYIYLNILLGALGSKAPTLLAVSNFPVRVEQSCKILFNDMCA